MTPNNGHAWDPAFCPLLGGLSSFGVSFIGGFTAVKVLEMYLFICITSNVVDGATTLFSPL